MQRQLMLFALLCMCSETFAQITEHGFVKEYNERQEKRPLNMVQLKVINAGTTTSSDDGSFLLQFRTLKAGDKVKLTRIYKEGYELFNTASVEQWNISNSGQPFEILMCSSRRFKKIYDRYAKTTYDSYARQQKAEEEKLEKERNTGIIKEQEFQQKLIKLQEEYSNKLDKIDNYIDRFARIDLTSLSDKEADILETIQQGDIDKAVLLYDDMELEKKLQYCSNKLKKTAEAIDLLREEQIQTLKERDSLYQIFIRSIDVLRLAGGATNFSKIKERMKVVADQDTTFITPVLYYADFADDQNLIDDCEKYAKIAERAYGNTQNDTLISIYSMLAKVQRHKLKHSVAVDYYQKALYLADNLGLDSLTYNKIKYSLVGGLIETLNNQGDLNKAYELYMEFVKTTRNLAEQDSLEYDLIYEMAKNNYALFLRDLGQYQKADSIWMSSKDKLERCYKKDTANYELLHALNEINIALSQMKQGRLENTESLLAKWIDPAYKNSNKDPNAYGDLLLMIKTGLMDYYHKTGEVEKLTSVADEIEQDCQRFMLLNPHYFLSYLIASQQNAGHHLTELKRTKKALEYLVKALNNLEKLKANNPELYYDEKTSTLVNLGVAHQVSGESTLAEQDWLSAIECSKNRNFSHEGGFSATVIRAYGNLGILYYKQGKFDLARDYLWQFFEYVEEIPNNIEEFGIMLVYALESMEDISLQKGETIDALGYLRALIEIAEHQGDTDKLSMYSLSASQLLWNIKEKKKARKWWKKAEEASPDYVSKHGVDLRKKIFGK